MRTTLNLRHDLVEQAMAVTRIMDQRLRDAGRRLRLVFGT
jgi:hypothetical protein